MMQGPRDSDALGRYLSEIADTHPLSGEREWALSRRIQEGDLEARDELVRANLRFVVSVAKRYQHRGLPLADLVGAGSEGPAYSLGGRIATSPHKRSSW